MTTLHPKLSTTRERQFVMAYGACSIWRLLAGPHQGEFVVGGIEPPHPEWTVATLPVAHRMCQALERRDSGEAGSSEAV